MNPPLTCSAVRAQLGDHLRSQLSPALALAFDRHLRGCAACRGALSLEQRLRAGAGPRLGAPTGFAAALLAQPRRRPVRAGQIGLLLGAAAADVAFRVLVDPLLRLHLELHDAGRPLWNRVTGPLTSVQGCLQAEGLKLCGYLAFPLQQAGQQVRAALAGSTDSP